MVDQDLEFSVNRIGGGTVTNIKTNAEGVASARRDYFLDRVFVRWRA